MINTFNSVVRLKAIVLHYALVCFLIVAKVRSIHDKLESFSVKEIGVVEVPPPIFNSVIISAMFMIMLPSICKIFALFNFEST